jgi:hypothetical protein
VIEFRQPPDGHIILRMIQVAASGAIGISNCPGAQPQAHFLLGRPNAVALNTAPKPVDNADAN